MYSEMSRTSFHFASSSTSNLRDEKTLSAAALSQQLPLRLMLDFTP